jgi:hypothetical protein
MKLFTVLIIWIAALFTGCESMSSRVQDRISGIPPQSRDFEANEKLVYDAGLRAVKKLGMNVGRTSRARGTIEAYNSIRAGDATRDTRQISLEVTVYTFGDGSRVELQVKESTEGAFPGGVNQQALRSHSLYELYFAALQRELIEAETPTAP